jgi:signal transduction histidine kinase
MLLSLLGVKQPPAFVAPGRVGRDHEVRAITASFLQLRPFVVAPYLLIQWLLVAASGAKVEQLVILGVASAAFLGVFIHEAFRARHGFVTGLSIFRSCTATLVAIAFVSVGTGAMASPMLPMMFAPVGVTFAVFGRTRPSAVILVVLIALGIVLAVLTPHVLPLAVLSPYRDLAMAASILGAAVLLYIGVASLTAAHRRAADALALQGDDALRATATRLREWEDHGAQIAHEMKNPLSAIQSLVEVMLETATDRNEKRLKVVAAELVRLNGIVEGYRSLATAAPFQAIRRAPLNVDALLSGLVMILDARAAQSGVSLSFELPAVSPAELRLADQLSNLELDQDRLKEALVNLVQNALQATQAGGRIELSRQVVEERVLQIRVKDNGQGMTPEVVQKLGTPYFSQRAGGTGLGVALARRVAEQHGGTLTYESKVGSGTTAILRLPLRLEDQSLEHGVSA